MTTLAASQPRQLPAFGRSAAVLFAAAAFAAAPLLARFLPPVLVDYPKDLVLPIADWVGVHLTWLAREASIGPVKVAEITRGIATVVEAPMRFLNVLINTGVTAGTGENVHRAIPPLSWLTIIGLAALAGHFLGGRRLAFLAAAGFAYLLVFGLWTDAMATLASVAMSTVVAVALGVAVGTFAARRPRLIPSVEGLMNVMQTVPVFSYLVPTLLFVGYGPSAALVATAIYALPPMVHATMLGLRSVPSEIVEYGRMAGATRRQLYWQVMVPSAVSYLGVGINQTIMACLNMVTIASMIGAGGLGYLVLLALRRLDIGAALEAGLGIVVLAVVLDRFSQAAKVRLTSGHLSAHSALSYRKLIPGWLVLSIIGSLLVPFFQDWPAAWTITTAPFWNGLISWINVHLFAPLDAFRSFTLINLMTPLKNYLLAMPWTVLSGLAGFAGWMLGGPRLAFFSAGLMTLIAVTGFWDPAVVSIYLVALGVLFSLLIGLPAGYAASLYPKSREAINLALDTLQTLPTLVYLIPAVMLFRNGDFSAVLAIVSYAVAPAVRYAMLGFSDVPHDRLEAASMSGATRFQTLRWVRLPHAFPAVILGINQTVMMAIAMLVITALVGTRDLGQQVFIALSRMKVGDGIVGGLAVAALALVSDALLKAWAARIAQRNGASPTPAQGNGG